ncbi:class I SAM-dependent methyltransferase [Candidatus Woesearchaeota archaeon]|nr:MAG: class I SAM-dependent methyltransferase [Candidatus Woesearchaeota archaeon]
MNKDENLWDHYQTDKRDVFEQGHPRQDLLFKQIKRLLPKDALIIEIGYGDGYLLRKLKQNGYQNLEGVDISPKNVELSRQKMPGIKFTLAKDELPFEDESVDCVIASEVIEHMSDEELEKFSKELNRTLKKGGYFIGSTPANENLKKAEIFCPNCNKSFHKYGHKQSYSKEKLERTFKPLKPEIIKTYFNRYPGHNLLTKAGGYLFYIARHTLHKIKPLENSGWLFVFKK